MMENQVKMSLFLNAESTSSRPDTFLPSRLRNHEGCANGAKSLKLLFFVFALLLSRCRPQELTLFQSLPSAETGILFNNLVQENDSINVLDYMNIYTGAGVAAGDFNNDGLIDLFFSANRSTCRLYLNKGNLKFEDITESAGLKTDRWCTGVSLIDLNQDGWLDIYVCVSGNAKWASTENLLFINQGKSSSSPTFIEKAADFGLADPRLTMNASFLDYDLDGDLDLFLITNPADQLVSNVNNVIEQKLNGEGRGTDILYRNDDGHFKDVSKTAGITKDGYSLSAAVADFNTDGWPDIYVSNDFISSDILYLNNGDGTFTDHIGGCLRHSSFASMGCDAADINNDGLTDIFTLDMLPEDHFRRKMLIPPVNMDKFEMALGKGYLPQYTRNTLQLNLGPAECSKGTPPAIKHPSCPQFSEIALLAGVASTDWSWSPLFADFDLDGDKDLLVTNGFFRDLGNLDYINYQFSQRSPMGTEGSKRAKKLADIKALESVPLQNYVFENNGNLTFSKRSEDWGVSEKGFSNGACFADLDNDGDLEIITNQFNAPAKIFRNNAREKNPPTARTDNYLTLKLSGKTPNLQGIGTKIYLFTADGVMQFQELNPARGYESCVDQRLFFGLGHHEAVDSLVLIWPNGTRQIERKIAANQIVELKQSGQEQASLQPVSDAHPVFQVTSFPTLHFDHTENYFIDFKNQILLPHQYSKSSPAMAVADVNGDGLEDFYISGAKDSHGSLFMQKSDGSFGEQILASATLADETTVLFFDADNDGDQDLFIGKGGSEYPEGARELQDELWENDGSGHFSKNELALPDTGNATTCIAASDFDHDGDLDLFLGGRVKPGEYPKSPRSYLLKNESLKGKGAKFTDTTPDFLKNIGMIADAIWADMDHNGFEDLILVGEFTPILIFYNLNGRLKLQSSQTINTPFGWWNTVTAADFDRDGDLDLVAGNLGLNTRFKADLATPVSVFADDFDKNGTIDPIFCHFENGQRFVFPTRDELVSQIPAMKNRFPNYLSFAQASFEKSFRKDELASAFELKATCFESSYFENDAGKFTRHALPIQAQCSPIQDFVTEDFNHDGYLDLLSAGNFYGSDYTTGRLDAGAGCLFLGDGKGNFKFMENRNSGFWSLSDARDLAVLRLNHQQKLILIGNNNNKMEVFLWK